MENYRNVNNTLIADENGETYALGFQSASLHNGASTENLSFKSPIVFTLNQQLLSDGAPVGKKSHFQQKRKNQRCPAHFPQI